MVGDDERRGRRASSYLGLDVDVPVLRPLGRGHLRSELLKFLGARVDEDRGRARDLERHLGHRGRSYRVRLSDNDRSRTPTGMPPDSDALAWPFV